jgi:predicted aspartyl protease
VPACAFADIYKYTDEDGVVNYKNLPNANPKVQGNPQLTRIEPQKAEFPRAPSPPIGTKGNIDGVGEKNTVRLFKNDGGVYEVSVLLNGVLSLNFIIDSGATEVMISPDVALTLLKTRTVSKADFLPGQRYAFADGSSADSPRFILRKLKIGSRVITNVPCAIGSNLDSPLLLGQSALEKLGNYSIDYSRSALVFGR